MNIGFTYDLKDDYIKAGFSEEEAAEFDAIDTIEGVEGALLSLGHRVERVGSVKRLAELLVAGKRWDLVFNIAEGVNGIGREAQVPTLLDAYGVPYVFSDPMVLALCLHKGMTKRVVRDGGVPTAKFHVVADECDLAEVRLEYPLFAKPVAEGTGKGIGAFSKITDAKMLCERCMALLEKHRQPVLVEEYLPGRECTVGIVGTGRDARVVGVMEVVFKPAAEKDAYGLHNKKNYKEIMDYVVPEKTLCDACGDVALAAWRVLECRDGGRVDVRCDRHGVPNFIEVNPLAGLHPIDSDLPILARLNGTDYRTLIGMIMDSALRRIERDRR